MASFIFYHGAVTLKGVRNAETLCLSALQDGETEINFCICSGGGDTAAGLGLYNFIKMLPITINTHSFGVCGSIAATIFLAGKRRTAAPASIFSLHAAIFTSGSKIGQIAPDTDIVALPFRTHLSWGDELVNKYFSTADDTNIYPDEALSMGIVHEVSHLSIGPNDKYLSVALPD